MKKLILILSLCLVLLLGAAVFLTRRQPDPVQTQPPAVVYDIRFTVLGKEVSRQQVNAGSLPKTFDAGIAGVTVAGWIDEQGNSVNPFAAPVSGNANYMAVTYLQLTGHKPYLFVDEEGLIKPDQVLTFSDLTAAVQALTAPEAAAYLPKMVQGDIPVNYQELMSVLCLFYEPAAISAAFPADTELTRATFAQGMNTLLGRDPGETFILADGAVIPGDITFERTGVTALLEACMAHTPAQQGSTWGELELPTSHEPGFMHVEGRLYYVKEDHYLLRDGKVGTLYFGADGAFTSGSEELDGIVEGLLAEMIAQNPDADRLALLRVAFNHCYQKYTYRRSYDNHPPVGSHGWEIQRALDTFKTGKDNCYGYAAIFWALARGLGYDALAVSGKVLSDEQPHSWCIIEMEDGKDYFFDPQWQYSYTERGVTDYDMFRIPMSEISFWGYQWSE